ncbi:hypothetical protein OF846_004133 [Rhodotorula toruloides]|nr:hypothetical protein OF846_004133 [Rhodotorula toruloides]
MVTLHVLRTTRLKLANVPRPTSKRLRVEDEAISEGCARGTRRESTLKGGSNHGKSFKASSSSSPSCAGGSSGSVGIHLRSQERSSTCWRRETSVASRLYAAQACAAFLLSAVKSGVNAV